MSLFDLTGKVAVITGSTKGIGRGIAEEMAALGAKIVISQHPRRTTPLLIDAEVYKWRHLIKNFFCKLKEFKRVAMRSDKTDQSFAALIYLAAAVINSR